MNVTINGKHTVIGVDITKHNQHNVIWIGPAPTVYQTNKTTAS